MKTLLTVRNLQTTFDIHVGRVQAVRGIDFRVDEGETVGLVGESGCGKSVSMMSFLRLLPRYAEILADEMTFDGKSLQALDLKALRKLEGNQIGMVFQDPMTSLNPLYTVEQQIAEPLKIHRGLSRRDARAEALRLLELVEMPDPVSRLAQYPHELSGGMRQRVMIAIAIACKPKLIIADEPTTALDVTIQAQILDLLRNLKRTLGTAVVLITHDLGVVADLCERVVVMYAGKIVEEGALRDIFYQPRHPYTWGLLRSIPSAKGVRQKLVPIPGTPPDLIAPPPGCPFAPRCPYAMNLCLTQMPAMRAISDSHRAACFLMDEGAPKVEWEGAKR